MAETEQDEQATGTPFTEEEYLYLLRLAATLPALVFWTRGNGGELQPLLMPVDATVLALH